MQLFISPDSGSASRRCDAPGGFARYAASYGPRLLCIPFGSLRLSGVLVLHGVAGSCFFEAFLSC